MDELKEQVRDSQVYDEEGVEWFVSNINEYFDTSREIIARLYTGEPLSINNDAKQTYPHLKLSEDTREELRKAGCIILHPWKFEHSAVNISHAEEPGALVVPVLHLPWITKEGEPTEQFLAWTLPNLEHETRYLGDFRKYNGAPYSAALLEARAFSKERDYQERTGQTEAAQNSETEYLSTYTNIINGNSTHIPHADIYMLRLAESLLPKLPHDKAKIIKEKLESYKAEYHITGDEYGLLGKS